MFKKTEEFDEKEGQIENGFGHEFDVPAEGLYLIEIMASAKSWGQNLISLRGFFNDDDLTVKLDGREFPKQNGKRGIFDGEVAWNGNNLKGLTKTNVFVVQLEKGKHFLEFLTDNKPVLRKIKVQALAQNIQNDSETQNAPENQNSSQNQKSDQEIEYLMEENNPAEDGDRRPWLTIVLVDLTLKSLKVSASVKKYPGTLEDDDLKLIINGGVEENTEPKAHKKWLWCGRAAEGEKEVTLALNLEKLLIAWNQGPFSLTAEGRKLPLNPSLLSDETKKFIPEVKEFYQGYQDEKKVKANNGFSKLFFLISGGLSFALISLIIGIFVYAHKNDLIGDSIYSTQEEYPVNLPKGKTFLMKSVITEENGEEKYWKLQDDFFSNGEIRDIDFHFYSPQFMDLRTEITYQGKTIETQGHNPSAFTKDINQDGVKELVVELGLGMHGVMTEIYKVTEESLEIIPVNPQDGNFKGFFNYIGIKFLNYDDDPAWEIEVVHFNGAAYTEPYSCFYKYVEGEFIEL